MEVPLLRAWDNTVPAPEVFAHRFHNPWPSRCVVVTANEPSSLDLREPRLQVRKHGFVFVGRIDVNDVKFALLE